MAPWLASRMASSAHPDGKFGRADRPFGGIPNAEIYNADIQSGTFHGI